MKITKWSLISTLTMIAFALLIVISCSKSKQSTNKMTVAQVKAEKGIDLIALWDAAYGTNGTARTNAKKPPRPNAATVVTVSYDLEASVAAGILSGTVSLEAYVAGGQKFADTTTNDNAIGLWGCNKSYTAPNTTQNLGISCSTEGGGGWCRVFSADFETYAVKLSKFVAN